MDSVVLADDSLGEVIREKLVPTILPDVINEVDLAVRDHITAGKNGRRLFTVCR